MNCEMCGKETRLSKAIVEGTIMSVCEDCIKYGEVIAVDDPVKVLKRQVYEGVGGELELIHPDCGKLVKKGRERRELTQEDLAKLIAEKASLIQKIEGGYEPQIKIARKLEQFLGIKLVVKEVTKKDASVKKKKLDLSDSSLTIGDILKMKK